MRYLLSSLIFLLSLSLFGQQKVAVYVTGDDAISTVLENRLVADIARTNQFIVVERTSNFIEELSREHAYERTGQVDDNQISELGKQFGVQYVCVASVDTVWKGERYLRAHVIDVESAEIIASTSSNGTISDNSNELIEGLNAISKGLLSALQTNKQNASKKVAVYVSPTGNRDVDLILGDQLVSGFARSESYIAVERTNDFLMELGKEHDYQRSGNVSDEQIKNLGIQYGAQYVCIAQTSIVFDNYYITSRIINLTTNEIVNVYNIEGRTFNTSKDVVNAASEIADYLCGRTIKEEIDYQSAEQERLRLQEQERLAQMQREQEQREKQELIIESLNAGFELVKAITDGVEMVNQSKQPPKNQKTTYTITIINRFSHTRLVYVDGHYLGEVPASKKVSFEVPITWYHQVTLVQKDGYMVYPTKKTYTKQSPPSPGQVFTIDYSN